MKLGYQMLVKLYLKNYFTTNYKLVITFLLTDLLATFCFFSLFYFDSNFNLIESEIVVFVFFFTNVSFMMLITDFTLLHKTVLYNIDIKQSKINWGLVTSVSTLIAGFIVFKIFFAYLSNFDITIELLYIIIFDYIQLLFCWGILWYVITRIKINILGGYFISLVLSSFLCSNISGFEYNFYFELTKLFIIIFAYTFVMIFSLRTIESKSGLILID